MGDRSRIEWTQATWNPVTGCTKVSPGCAYCYAEAFTLRFRRGGPYLPGETTITLHHDRLDLPLRWRAPRLIFVNSMSDLFHESVPDSFISAVFQVMCQAPQHRFQVLTKRHERLASLAPLLPFPDNVWIGVSIENQYWAERRIPELKRVPAKLRFLSCEPLLGPVNLRTHLKGLHWVIAGGESGPRARPAHLDWIRDLRDQCQQIGVAFFLKQLGGHPHPRGHDEALLDGRLWREMPELGHEFVEPRLLVGLGT